MPVPPERIARFLCKSASCAAVPGSQHKSQSIRKAIAGGLAAARFNICLPLTPLLDMQILCSRTSRGGQLGRRSKKRISRAVNYDLWLQHLCEILEAGLSMDHPGAPQVRPLPIPMISHHWPNERDDNLPGSLVWEAAYRILQDSPKTGEIVLKYLNAERSQDEGLWKRVWPAEFDPRKPKTLMPEMLSLFQWFTNEKEVYKSFEYSSCHLYYHADDPLVLPNQQQKINRLRRRHDVTYLPVLRTPDDQDPYYGTLPLALLVKRPFDYVASSVINNWDSRFNRAPSVSPPKGVHIHLCWTTGFCSVTEYDQVIKATRSSVRAAGTPPVPNPPGTKATVKMSRGAVVQAFVCLLLEDLRNALTGLPITFSLHRLTAAGDATGVTKSPPSVKIGLPGPRWKSAICNGGILPPGSAVSQLFGRRSGYDANAEEAGWVLFQSVADEIAVPLSEMLAPGTGDGSSPFSFSATSLRQAVRQWYCGVVSESDLNDLGLISVQSSNRLRSSDPILTGPLDLIPKELTHLIVLDDSFGRGGIYTIQRMSFQDRLELRQIPLRRKHSEMKDVSFINLRTEILDVVLDIISQKMT